MTEKDYLLDELKRLNRLNDSLEKNFIRNDFIKNEPEQIKNNVLTMCEIVKAITYQENL